MSILTSCRLNPNITVNNRPTLYIDYDGVLHPADVRVTVVEPRQPRVYNGGPTDYPLFEHAPLLEGILVPFPDVQLILSTSWVRTLGYEFTVQQLPQALRKRVIGTVWHGALLEHPPRSRYDSVQTDANDRGLQRWLALDDDVDGWPDEQRYRLIAPNNAWHGLGESGVADELAKALALLCAGGPLETRRPAAPEWPSTVERLFGPVELAQPRGYMPTITPDERAQHEDAVLKKALAEAWPRRSMPMSTPESVRRGEAIIAQAQERATAAMSRRIARGELINAADLQHVLGIDGEAIASAIQEGRLFAIAGPNGDDYYPAFYADPTLDHLTLEEVSRALAALPAASKFHFFMSRFTSLESTPLDALRKGRKAAVLAAAEGFAER